LECKQFCRGKLPDGVPNGILSENTLAKISVLTGKYRLSKREVKEFLFDFFCLKISVGTISNAEHIVSKSIETPVEEMGKTIVQQTRLHADETSHIHKGGLEWLWVATNDKLTYFRIYQNRNQISAKALIGEDYKGMIVTDRYGAYNWLPKTQRQYCWSHLKRDFKKISERIELKEALIGNYLLNDLRSIFHYWRHMQSNPEKSYYYSLLRRTITHFYIHLRRGKLLKDTKTGKFCAKLIRERKSLWHFMHMSQVDATNNHAERQLRHAVIWRKKCYGTQSRRGINFVERILSTIMTCKQQKCNLIEFIEQSIQSTLLKKPYPSLTH
jgi:transposase